jgi:hypothetical protein
MVLGLLQWVLVDVVEDVLAMLRKILCLEYGNNLSYDSSGMQVFGLWRVNLVLLLRAKFENESSLVYFSLEGLVSTSWIEPRTHSLK